MRTTRNGRSICAVSSTLLALTLTCNQLDAAGGTMQVASKGESVSEREHWPQGTRELLDLPTRGDGWNGWFSEWPNDVCHYEFKAADSAEINAIIDHFAKITSEDLHIRLSPLKEPRGLGWVTSLPEGNDTAVLFSIGNQQRVDEWYGRLAGGVFGKMEFEKTPVAVPPTLTVFVGNDAVELTELVIPQGIEVSAGNLPAIFWEWNQANRPARAADAPAPPEIQQTMDLITEYLEKRQQAE